MASAAGAPSVANLWCLWVLLLLMWMFHATEYLSQDRDILLSWFKDAVVDRRGRLSNRNGTDDHPCNWIGVQCDNSTAATPDARVVALELPSFELLGTISLISNSCYLDQLTRLDLSGNKFSGQIPLLGDCLSSLIYLRLGDNALTGPIPRWLPPHLTYLYLGNNFVVGDIGVVQRLRLIELDLHGKRLSGSLPTSPGWTRSLESLDLSGNQFEGTLPLTFGNWSRLSYMNMSSNNFTGEIPQGPWPTVAVVDLSQNLLSGSIPRELLNGGRTYLDLSSNSLTGTIAEPTVQPTVNMWFLDLSNNQLSGPFPEEFIAASSVTLRFLYLQNNQLTGNLQSIFSADSVKFPSLLELKLSGNRLTVGTLPRLLASSFPRLRVLELAQSNVEGELWQDPNDFFQWRDSLEVLDLSENGLQGSPVALPFLRALRELRLAGNDLSGDTSVLKEALWWITVEVLDLSHNRLTWNNIGSGGILQSILNVSTD